jgi:DNA-binding response OmpR family regulator
LFDQLRQRFGNRTVFVVGFDEQNAAALWLVLSRFGAFARRVEADPIDVLPDLVIGRVSGLDDAQKTRLMDAVDTPTLLFGSMEEIVALSEGQTRRGLDVAVEPWREDDLLLRCSRLLSRDAPAHPSNEPAAPSAQDEPGREVAAADSDEFALVADPEAEDTPPGETSEAAASSETANEGPIRILVADDDPVTTALIKAAAEAEGFECLTASDGIEALKLIESTSPDVLILDVSMPGYNGFEVLSQVKEMPGGPKTMMLTASRREEDAVRGFDLGAEDFVSKPFNLLEFRARIRKLVRG